MGVWQHVEVYFDYQSPSCMYFLVNGQASAPQGYSLYSSGFGLLVGRAWEGSMGYSGYIDELWIVRGVCAHMSSFTPPTGPYSG